MNVVSRKKNALENMAIIRHIVSNILQHADSKISIIRRKKKAGWSDEYLENVLKQKILMYQPWFCNNIQLQKKNNSI